MQTEVFAPAAPILMRRASSLDEAALTHQLDFTAPEAPLSPRAPVNAAAAENETQNDNDTLHQLDPDLFSTAQHQSCMLGASRRKSKARVACRIKPLGAETRDAGTQSQKQLVSWDANSITTSRTRHTFLQPVIPAEATQRQVYETLMPELVDGFLNGYDVNFLALGQTGAGKTHTIFGPPKSMARAWANGDPTIQPEHGILIRTLSDIHEHVCLINSSGQARAVLTGSMVELNFENPLDLLNNKQPCALDKENRLIGATQLPISTPRDIVQLCAAVESRTTDATLANDVSSRTHCVTTLTLTTLRDGRVRSCRFNVVDMMGTERSKGQNSAHDVSQNNKKSVSGMQGIYANFSVFGLMGAIREAVQAKKRSKGKARSSWTSNSFSAWNFSLTRFLKGSMDGSALTSMVVALSQASRNGSESCISLDYGSTIASLPANPQQQPGRCAISLRRHAEEQRAAHTCGLETLLANRARSFSGGGKYEEIRRSEIRRWSEVLVTLDQLTSM